MFPCSHLLRMDIEREHFTSQPLLPAPHHMMGRGVVPNLCSWEPLRGQDSPGTPDGAPGGDRGAQTMQREEDRVPGSDPFSSANQEPLPPQRTLNCSSARGGLTLPDLPYRAVAGRRAVESPGQCHGRGHRFRNVPEPGALGQERGERPPYSQGTAPSFLPSFLPRRPQRGQSHYRGGTSSRQRQIGLIDPN